MTRSTPLIGETKTSAHTCKSREPIPARPQAHARNNPLNKADTSSPSPRACGNQKTATPPSETLVTSAAEPALDSPVSFASANVTVARLHRIIIDDYLGSQIHLR